MRQEISQRQYGTKQGRTKIDKAETIKPVDGAIAQPGIKVNLR
jgi:hypothetical protein